MRYKGGQEHCGGGLFVFKFCGWRLNNTFPFPPSTAKIFGDFLENRRGARN